MENEKVTAFRFQGQLTKVDDSLGLVFGYGIVCTVNGEPYYDTQGDCVPEAAMLEAAADFMTKSRVSTDMHARGAAGEVVPDGNVVFAFPLTTDIAKAFGIQAERTGLLVALKPSPAVLAKFKDGSYTGFSIGGTRIDEEVVEA